MFSLRLRGKHVGTAFGDDFLRRLKIFFQEERRDGEHIANIIETVAGIVRGKFLGGIEIDAHQIADGVLIFNAI